MNIIFFLAILTAVSAVSVPSKIEQFGFPLIPKNDYIGLGFFTIKIFQDITEDLGLTMSYNLTTKDGQSVANEGPAALCEPDPMTQWDSMLTILSTALNIEEPNCPHAKGEHSISRRFDLELIFDEKPSCDSNLKVTMKVCAPDEKDPILEVSFKIYPQCDNDDSNNDDSEDHTSSSAEN